MREHFDMLTLASSVFLWTPIYGQHFYLALSHQLEETFPTKSQDREHQAGDKGTECMHSEHIFLVEAVEEVERERQPRKAVDMESFLELLAVMPLDELEQRLLH